MAIRNKKQRGASSTRSKKQGQQKKHMHHSHRHHNREGCADPGSPHDVHGKDHKHEEARGEGEPRDEHGVPRAAERPLDNLLRGEGAEGEEVPGVGKEEERVV